MRPRLTAGTKMNKGFSLLLIILIIATLLMLGATLSRLTLNNMNLANDKIKSLQAFYLAEAGIERAKYELKNNPNWYTDLPHSPADDVDWIINGAKGKIYSTAVGDFKIIREKDKLRAYAVGTNLKSQRIIKIEFGLSPYNTKSWGIL